MHALHLEFERIWEEEDFISFCKFLRIKNKDSKKRDDSVIQFCYSNWHNEQKSFQANRCGRDIVLKPRQIGFSTIEQARDLFHALSRPNKRVVIVTHNAKLARDFMATIREMYQCLVELSDAFQLDIFIPLNSMQKKFGTFNQALKISFPNGSEIEVKTAGDKANQAADVGRGTPISRLHITEFALWKFPDEAWQSLEPALMTDDSEVVIESTPKGTGNPFHRFFLLANSQVDERGRGYNGFKSHFFPWYLNKFHVRPLEKGEELELTQDEIQLSENARRLYSWEIKPENFKWYRSKLKEMGDRGRLLTEYASDSHSCFVGSSNTFLNPNEMAFLQTITEQTRKSNPPEAIDGYAGEAKIYVYSQPKEGRRYLVAGDPAGGGGGDNSAMAIIDLDSGELCSIYACNRILPGDFGSLLVREASRYNHARIVVELPGPGETTLERIRGTERYPHLYEGKYNLSLGSGVFRATTNSKLDMLENMKKWISEGLINIMDEDLRRELSGLAYDEKMNISAKGKTHSGQKTDESPRDDRAFCFAMALQVRKELPRWDESYFQNAFAFGGSRQFGKHIRGWG
jgi:hypothetical protein